MPREVGARCKRRLWACTIALKPPSERSAAADAEGCGCTVQAPAVARDITNQRVGLYAFYGNPYALVSGRGRIDLRLGRTFTAALSVLECRGAQSKRKTTRHSSSGTNQVEPRCRKALMRETTGLCQPLPIDLSTYRSR